jgi:hypothetical protein
MKIDTDGLKAAYQENIREKIPPSPRDCPSPKKIVRLLRSGCSDKEATKLIEHISHCSSCFTEFGFVSEVLRQEKDFVEEVIQRLPDDDQPGRRKERRQRAFGWRSHWRALIPRFSWSAALILAGTILVGFFVAKSTIFQPSEKYRSGTLPGIQLIEPAGERASRAALVFRWKKVNNSRYYICELFDQALKPIWNSEEITENELAALPKDINATLEVNRSYFWMVTAYLKNGEKISSRLEKFSLRE